MINGFKNTFLSNFYPCEVRLKGVTYKCAEAAFQAMKTHDKNDWAKISLMTGAESKSYGKRVKLRPDWNESDCSPRL